MPEISGKIVFKAQNETVTNSLLQFREETPACVLEKLTEATGLNPDWTDLFLEDGFLASDSVAHFRQLTVIEPLGDEWIKLLEALQHAKGLEFWAHIQHEHGLEYFIALVGPQYFSNAFDLEDSDLEDEEIDEIEQNWLDLVPADIKRLFADEFDTE